MDCSYKEMKIPVPWGHIAGKIWGNPSGQKLLAIHGLQDNCGVYDQLIPLLRGDYYIVAIDLPGHGLSSHFPNGIPLDFLNYIIAVFCVVEYVHWKRFFFLGHSLGGQIGYFFAAAFPDYIEKLIVIDHVGPTNSPDIPFPVIIRSWATKFRILDERLKKGKSPIYSYQEALEKLTNRNSVLTTEAAKTVLKRSLRKIGNNEYVFVMDQRLKLNTSPTIRAHHMEELLSSLKCPVLSIFSSERYEIYKQNFEKEFEILKRKLDYTEKIVQGNHDVHQNHPERVVELVDEFFTSQICRSWGNPSGEKRVLLVHGILHNCASFNKLIRLLPNEYCMVAIDLPGHGFSSYFPPGLPLDFFNFVLCIKRVVDHLQWRRFCFIGHSFGSQVGTYFAALFGDLVESLIVIDSMEPRPVPLDDTLSHIQLATAQLFQVEDKLATKNQPIYTYDEAFEKTQMNRYWPLDKTATEDLLQRSIIPKESGFVFVNDQRLKYLIRPVLTFEQQKLILDGVVCPVLFILSKSNMERYGTYLKQVYEYNKTKENCTIVEVEGDHAVHQNFPERISSLIYTFISAYK